MKKKHLDITINATPEKVWEKLWSNDGYREWTSAFAAGSRMEGELTRGSKIHFIDDKNDGMVVQVEENIPNEFMSFALLGEVHQGVEDTTSDKVRPWAGGHENYTLKAVGNTTELSIDFDVIEDFEAYMMSAWPKALARLKAIAEQN